jgi:hypothetical protein
MSTKSEYFYQFFFYIYQNKKICVKMRGFFAEENVRTRPQVGVRICCALLVNLTTKNMYTNFKKIKFILTV